MCQAVSHAPGCDGIGTDCDHIKAGDDHRISNLQWLSGPCHKAKTAAEALIGRGAGSRKRPTPRPPGVSV